MTGRPITPQEVAEAAQEARALEAVARPLPGPAPQAWSESELAAKWARGRHLNLAEAQRQEARA